MYFADHRHQIAQELGLVSYEAPEPARRRRNGKAADTGIVLPRPFGVSPSDVRTVDLTAQPQNVGQLAACLNTLLSAGLDTRVCKGKKEPLYKPTRTNAVDDMAAIAKLEADVAKHPARRFMLFALHYADLSRRVGLCVRPYECATATHTCNLTSGRPLFPGFCATCIDTVRSIVTAAILIHDLCQSPFETARACKYVHVFFRECLRFQWTRNGNDKKVRDASEAAYFCAWVSVCARRVFERLEAYHVDDAADVDVWNTKCLLPLTADPLPEGPVCDMAFPGHTGIISDTAPYTTVPCVTCRDIHRAALAPGQEPAPNPKSKEKLEAKKQQKKAKSESGVKRKYKSDKAAAPKRSRPSANNTDSDADDSASSMQPRLPPAPPVPLPLPAVESSMHTTEGAASFPAFSDGFADSSKFVDDEENVHHLFENYHAVEAIVPASMKPLERPVLALPPLPALPPAPAPMANALAKTLRGLSSVVTTRPSQAPALPSAPAPAPAPYRALVLVDDDEDDDE